MMLLYSIIQLSGFREGQGCFDRSLLTRVPVRHRGRTTKFGAWRLR